MGIADLALLPGNGFCFPDPPVIRIHFHPHRLSEIAETELFDAIVDGTRVTKAKPDPEVFTVGSQLLGAAPADCIVFEDAVAGIDAAHAAGMQAVGIGTPGALPKADAHLPAGFAGVTPSMVEALLTV